MACDIKGGNSVLARAFVVNGGTAWAECPLIHLLQPPPPSHFPFKYILSAIAHPHPNSYWAAGIKSRSFPWV